MARKPTVNLTDTFETWRQKTNQISSNVGDPDALTTPVTSDLVNALNEVNSRTTQSFIRNSISLVANNNSHSTLSYNPGSGVITYTSNAIVDSDIPPLDASKIATGIFHPNQIPGLDACMIITGTLDSARLPAGAFEFHRNGLSSKTTDNLQEGSVNLYYTNQRVYAAMGVYPGDSTLDYNSATGQYRVNTSLFNMGGGSAAIYGDSDVRSLVDSAYVQARSTFNPLSFSTDLIPDGNETRSLGSATNRIKDLHIANSSIYFGGSSKELGFDSANNQLTFDGNPIPTGVAGTKVYRQQIQIPALNAQQTMYEWVASNFPTGITRKPDHIIVKIVCTAISFGYGVGDVIYMPMSFEEEDGLDQGYNVFWNSANQSLNLVFGEHSPFMILDKNTRVTEYVRFNNEANNWDMIIELLWYGNDADEDIDATGTFTQV